MTACFDLQHTHLSSSLYFYFSLLSFPPSLSLPPPPRLVVDEWLELKFSDAASGQQVVSSIQTLRNTWTKMLETKLEASQSKSR